MITKVQGHSSTARAKKAHRVLMHHRNKFTASTQMDAEHLIIGRKILDLHGKKARIERMILGEIITKPEVATQVEAMVRAELKTDLSIACSTKETLTIGQGIVPSS
jgi:hypothetical protein